MNLQLKFPLTLHAVAAVILPACTPDRTLNESQHRKWFEKLQDEVILAAMHNLCMKSLQALLNTEMGGFLSTGTSWHYVWGRHPMVTDPKFVALTAYPWV
jgi:hypothetical protein